MVQNITRQYGAVQNSIVLHITVYYSSLQYSQIQYNIGGTVHYTMVEYNVPWSSTIQYGTVRDSMMQYDTVLCSTIQFGPVQHRVVQYSAVLQMKCHAHSPKIYQLNQLKNTS